MNQQQYEILTPNGFKSFSTIKKNDQIQCVCIKFCDNTTITVSTDHEFLCTSGRYTLARKSRNKKIKTADGHKRVVSVKRLKRKQDLYDVCDVPGEVYITNDVVSHNCGLLTSFWASVYPIISSSTKSKIILASTPRDTAGLFYRLYQKSISNDPENVWVSKVVKWDEVPGRDENWVRQTKAAMDDPTLFDREFNCVFAETGESAIDQSYFELLKSRCSAPEHILDDGDYKVWQLPSEDRIYVAGVDISEGVGQDASCIQILDITDPTNIIQAAQYYSTTISPFQFTPKLHEILQNWGNPLAMIERNNCGAQVVDNLKNVYNYENIVCYGQKEANRKNAQLGVISHTNTKSRGVTNMRYWVTTNKAVHFNDVETVNEIRTFQKGNNATWKAANGKRDDRVMSLVWALMILSEELVTKYFDIIEVDNYNKPLIIKPLDFGIKYYMNPTTIYTDKGDGGNALPVIWGGYSGNADIDDLNNDGWQFLGDFSNGR